MTRATNQSLLTAGPMGLRPVVGICDVETEPSGITRYVLALLDGIDRDRFDVVFYCRRDGPYQGRAWPGVRIVHLPDTPNGMDGAAGAPPARQSVGRRRLPSRWPRATARAAWRRGVPQPVKHLAGFLRTAGRLTRTFARYPVDLLHAQVISDSKAVVAARMAGVAQVVGTYHLDPGRNRLHALLPEIVTTRCLHHAVAVSRNTQLAWIPRPGIGPTRISVIPNGVDVDQYRRRTAPATARHALGIPPDADPVLAVVGRLEEQKGHRYLLPAIAELMTTSPGIYLVLAGDGMRRDDLARQAAALGIAGRVRFAGHIGDVQTVLDAADIFVLPSLWEALPFALLEAMASGLPVVATAVAGVPELVEHNQTGLLVPAADPSALAASLSALITRPELAKQMGAAARDRVRAQFSLASMLDQTQSLYDRLLARAVRRN